MKLNTINNCNCIEGLRTLPDNYVDLVVTSPPYDNLRDYNKSSSWNFEIFKEIAIELFRVIQKGGVIVWVVGDSTAKGTESGSSFRQALFFKELGFLLHDTMIYEKNGATFPASRKSNRYSQVFEYMFILSKEVKPKTANLICDKENRWAGYTNWGKNTYRTTKGELKTREKTHIIPDFSPRNNIWRYNTGRGFSSKDKLAFEHPAIFPEKLAEDHILTWSEENQIVLDPFLGTGTTALMAEKLNRNYLGFEVDETYFNLCLKRGLKSFIP